MKALVLLLLVLVVVGGCGAVSYVSTTNNAIDLQTQAEAQQKVNESYFGQMWAILKQQAGVTESYKDSFKEIYVPLMEGRYGNGNGQLMQWVQEANPTFDSSLFERLMVTIEAKRTEFHNEQKKLISINQQYENLRRKFPSSIFMNLGGYTELEITVVTNKATTEAFSSGEEQVDELF